MEFDNEKIDQAALALLFVNSWQEGSEKNTRSWKTLDWDIGDRLHKQGLITDPVGKAKSVYLTDEGVEAAKKIAAELFAKPE